MALSLLNAELIVQRDEARQERDAWQAKCAQLEVAAADKAAQQKPARKR
jgi:hypothetical protein